MMSGLMGRKEFQADDDSSFAELVALDPASEGNINQMNTGCKVIVSFKTKVLIHVEGGDMAVYEAT
ncbi:hypothetical protein P7K49_037677, partial [Saguinus oedipus]